MVDRGMILRMRWTVPFLAGILAVTAFAGTPPTVDEVMDAVLRTPLATTNPAVKSYETEMSSGGLRASFWYTHPHRTALWVIDAQDGTPVLATADGMVAIYDTMASTVVLITNLYGGLKFSSHSSKEPGKSGVNFNFNLQSEPTNAQGEILLPRKIESTNFRAELRPLGQGRYEVRGSDSRINPKNGETMAWTFTGLTDWPPRDIPYRSLEIRGGRYLNLTVKSVNETIPASCFEFPLQALLSSGLPIRRLSMVATNDIARMAGLLMANLSVRQALQMEDPEKTRESLRSICKDFTGADAGREIEHLFSDPASVEKMLAEMTAEQWESTRAKLFPDLSPQEFDQRKKDPAFRKQMAEKIVAGMARPIDQETGQGPTYKDYLKGLTAGFAETARNLEKLDVKALQARDRKIAAQLRQAFQLEPTPAR